MHTNALAESFLLTPRADLLALRPVTLRKNKYTKPPRHLEERSALFWPRSDISRRVSLRSSLFPLSIHPPLASPPPPPPPSQARARARARPCARVSACTYIRYLRAYIWVPIYRYQMVNERVDARSGRPQLAATQSFVYRGAVCATARTGWPRSVGIFSPAHGRRREETAVGWF